MAYAKFGPALARIREVVESSAGLLRPVPSSRFGGEAPTGLDLEMQQLAVMMDGREVIYDFLELDELVHAFAISVHKSQGSEFPAVVIPILTSHYMMLQRNVLYTAITRLVEKKLIAPQAAAGRQRPYRLTAQGAASLRELLDDMRRVAAVGLTRLKDV